ncbi:MAG: hypothetical protein A2Y20_04105 [Firmicutes bacterium GWF2_51_9]|nr:MAG: hypothetical protein A2Y20_04105 [Firmicutes bacterium GWF2_51_9]OGS59612.1 MAG: hypothetical protein A2Y19_01685 [Firmicutes bacterium GWE2_51_13]HBZ41624.1 hypothetical protein [Erysipelotrichaceae bacterium]
MKITFISDEILVSIESNTDERFISSKLNDDELFHIVEEIIKSKFVEFEISENVTPLNKKLHEILLIEFGLRDNSN